MKHFILSGVYFTFLYLLPVAFLHLICHLVFRNRSRRLAAQAEDDRARLTSEIRRYLGYLLAAPGMMLMVSVVMGYAIGFDHVMDSMIWLIVAITIAFAWTIRRLVRAVIAKGRLEAQVGEP